MQIELDQLRTDGGTQPRATYHYGIVDSYAEDMGAGAILPPVTVFYDGADYWLADGFHRVLAAKKIEWASIEADVRQGTQQDAQWYSYSVNQTHGLRRSNDDKRRAVEAALAHPYHAGKSDQQIAGHCGVSIDLVNKLSHHLAASGKIDRPTTRTVTRKGKTYQQNTASIGKKRADKQPEASSSSNGKHPSVEYQPDPASMPSYANTIAAPPANTYTIPLPIDVEGAAETIIREFTPDEVRQLVELLAAHIAVNA